ncbi:MAG: aminotransferase class V-fold PLP-dependent enzyme [Kofleriaceae bacterium]|nr:aminotransferase class V-fold PLP-dependent enzyme [Kofleriaceae bacterium]
MSIDADSANAAPLALDADEFRRAGHALVDRIAAALAARPQGPVTPSEAPDVVRAALGAEQGLPAQGRPANELLDRAAELLMTHSLFNGHPRFFGYITSSPAPIGMLGDMLAAAVNANVGSWLLAPMATEIEAQTVRWVAELIGYDPRCGGLLVSGGNMANLVPFWAARRHAATWDIRVEGVAAAGAPRLRVYASVETHTWIQKAADLAGLGTDAVRFIPTDAAFRMNVATLRRTLDEDRARGDVPMMVVATAGTVSTGAVDPLAEIAALCRERKIWFHVDGAYGAFAVCVPGTPDDLRAIREADSVAIDPHKWLYAPLEAGCVLVRDVERLRAAFAYHPPYYHFGTEALNYVDLGPQNSRGLRALKVWLGLQHAGREGYVQMISTNIALSQQLHREVLAHAELQPLTQSLSITTFRYVPADLRAGIGTESVEKHLDALNRELLVRIQASGEAFVSNAVLGGIYALRACIVNFHTTPRDITMLPEIVARIGRGIDRELRAK